MRRDVKNITPARADTIVSNPDYVRARELVKESIVRSLIDLDIDQLDEEHELVLLLRAGETFHRMFEAALSTESIETVNEARREAVV